MPGKLASASSISVAITRRLRRKASALARPMPWPAAVRNARLPFSLPRKSTFLIL